MIRIDRRYSACGRLHPLYVGFAAHRAAAHRAARGAARVAEMVTLAKRHARWRANAAIARHPSSRALTESSAF
jgi:hypothetical protein